MYPYYYPNYFYPSVDDEYEYSMDDTRADVQPMGVGAPDCMNCPQMYSGQCPGMQMPAGMQMPGGMMPGMQMPAGMQMPSGMMPGMQMPAGMQMPGAMQTPTGLGNIGAVGPGTEFNPGFGSPLPSAPQPGTTAGMPVEPVTPAPITIPPSPVGFTQEPGPPVITDIGYTQAYLKANVGKRVRAQFLIGTNIMTDRVGTLVDVGISYILIKLQESDDIELCDIYSLKFMTFMG